MIPSIFDTVAEVDELNGGGVADSEVAKIAEVIEAIVVADVDL